MPTPKKGARLGGSPAHQKLIVSNLATALFEHGRITTTEARARVLRPVAEKLITKAKRGDLHNRREVLKTIRDKSVVHTLFTEIAVSFAERPGGYTRITKIGPRKGDNAPMAVIELVTEAYSPKPKTAKAARAEEAPKAEAPAEETPVEETQAEDTPAEDTEAELVAVGDPVRARNADAIAAGARAVAAQRAGLAIAATGTSQLAPPTIDLALVAIAPVCLLSYHLIEAQGIALGRRVIQARRVVAAE